MLKKWLLVAAALAVVVAVAMSSLPDPVGKVSEGELAPDFSLADMSGVQRGLPKGKVVLLNFWATWCPPCRDEMPSMVDLSNKLADKGLVIVAASVDKDPSKLAAFINEFKIPFQVLKDSKQSVARRYGVLRYPETFLIDRQGKVRYHLIGAVNWMDTATVKAIESLLAEKKAG